jgi:protein CWC15
MSGNIPIPTATKRAIDVPAQTKLLYREPLAPKDREELKRKLEVAEQTKPTEPEEVLVDLPESDSEASGSEQAEEEEGQSASEDEEELMRELARIKQERAEAKLKRQAEQAVKEEAIAQANPLLSGGASALRRRWDDDTVFRGQASSKPTEKKKTFVNDAVRTQSHKKFLNKYIV